MKRLSKVLLVFVLSFVLFVAKTSAKEKVKVYIFEAGGCPYCEKEVEYLESLDSYNEKFEIIRKELYVDHIDWEQGKDYDLGVKVANAFNKKGFDNASYQGTPFVVISNSYAAASYSEDLETYINEAYDKGDKDIVGCFEKGKENCEDKIAKEKKKTTNNSSNTLTALVTLIIIGVVVVIIIIKTKIMK